MKAMRRALSQKQNRKNEINDSKDIKDILNTSYLKNQKSSYSNDKKRFITHLCHDLEDFFKIRNMCNCVNIPIFPYPVSNIPIWGKVRVY